MGKRHEALGKMMQDAGYKIQDKKHITVSQLIVVILIRHQGSGIQDLASWPNQ
jgi:hypothetical protein